MICKKNKNCILTKQKEEPKVQQDKKLDKCLKLLLMLISLPIPAVYNQHTWGLGVVRTGPSLQTNWPYAKNDYTKKQGSVSEGYENVI